MVSRKDENPSVQHQPDSSTPLHNLSTRSLPSLTSIPDSNSSNDSSNMSTEMPTTQAYRQSAPSTSQPYQPIQPNHFEGTQDPQTSNQYPQYSYDIQLRYPNAPDAGRVYEQPHYSGPPRIALPPMSAMTMQDQAGYNFPTFTDTTGQIAPPGAKPRVTATLWEDEGTLCFQVDVNGTCVARREDNHMINGTKLLNVVGMTRGRRDGILKSEKMKHVVKIGPMHLKGVWIPFERALEFANKEKITESLYPLFVHNIGALLYHPSNQYEHAAMSRNTMIPRSENTMHQQHTQNLASLYSAAPQPQAGEERPLYS